MKRILLSLAMLSVFYSTTAQVFETNDFSAYTNGNIGTNTNGNVIGQGGFYTLNGINTDYRILNDGLPHAKVLQLTGSATSETDRFMWKEGLPMAWAAREEGNDILEIEFDYFTGPISLSNNSMRVVVFNADYSKVLAGFMVEQDTKIVSGLAYYSDDDGAGLFQFSLGSNSEPDVILPTNTWVRLGMGFKKSEGKVIWKGPGFDSFANGTTAGEDPAEIDFIATAIDAPGATNAVASTARFDNYIVRAVAVDGLLGVENVQTAATIAVYPNPVNNIVNITTKGNPVDRITIADMNGRIVKEAQFDKVSQIEMDLSPLSKGIYLMNITSGNKSDVKKIIKN